MANHTYQLLKGHSQATLDAKARELAARLDITDFDAFDAWDKAANELREAAYAGRLLAMPNDIPPPSFDPLPLLKKAKGTRVSRDCGGVFACLGSCYGV